MDWQTFTYLINPKRLRFAPISADGEGSHEIAPGTPGEALTVMGYVLSADGPCAVKFVDDGGDLTGPFPITQAGDGLDPGFNPVGHFRTRTGQGLALVVTGDAQVGGHLVYRDDTPGRESRI